MYLPHAQLQALPAVAQETWFPHSPSTPLTEHCQALGIAARAHNPEWKRWPWLSGRDYPSRDCRFPGARHTATLSPSGVFSPVPGPLSRPWSPVPLPKELSFDTEMVWPRDSNSQAPAQSRNSTAFILAVLLQWRPAQSSCGWDGHGGAAPLIPPSSPALQPRPGLQGIPLGLEEGGPFLPAGLDLAWESYQDQVLGNLFTLQTCTKREAET